MEYIRHEFGHASDGIRAVVGPEQLPDQRTSADDIWLATHWVTAHSLQVASHLDVIEPRHVIYLVQDYEPGFNAWSSEYALARATYGAGFTIVVNSTPLRDYLEEAEGLRLPDRYVFRPSLDLSRLEQASLRRKNARNGPLTLGFYARPDKPRNLFSIGMCALGLAVEDQKSMGMEVKVQTLGGLHPRPASGPLMDVMILGRLSWPRYFEQLSGTDVFLSLQHSPHPSHPPLDAVVSGGWSVTNEFEGTRARLHNRLLVAEPEPKALARSIREAVGQAVSLGPQRFDPSVLLGLGEDMATVVRSLAESLRI